MRYAQTPILRGADTASLVAQRYDLEDLVVTPAQLDWSPDDGEVAIRLPQSRRPRVLKWGGDAFNHLVKDLKIGQVESDRQFLLRIKGDVVVGGLTTEYFPIPNSKIIDAIRDAGLETTNWRLSPSRSYFFAVDGEIISVNEEAYKPGVAIINSETGYKRLQIHSGLIRLVCMNGAYVVAPNSDQVFDKLHLRENFQEGFEVGDTITEMLDSARDLFALLEHTREFADTADHVAAWLNMEFGTRQKKQILRNLELNPDAPLTEAVPRFELLNAVTLLHQTFPKTVDRWHELGGLLLDETYIINQVVPPRERPSQTTSQTTQEVSQVPQATQS